MMKVPRALENIQAKTSAIVLTSTMVHALFPPACPLALTLAKVQEAQAPADPCTGSCPQ